MPDPEIGWYIKCYGAGRWMWAVAIGGGKVIGQGIASTKEVAGRRCWEAVEEHFVTPMLTFKGDYNALKEFLENLPEFGEATYEPEWQEPPDGSSSPTADEDVHHERDGAPDEGAGAGR